MSRTAPPRLLALTLLLVACSTRAARPPAEPRPGDPDVKHTVRVALTVPDPALSATRDFSWLEADGRTLIAIGRAGDQWRLQRETPGARIRAIHPNGLPTAWQRTLVLRSDEGFVTVNGKRYRGDLVVLPIDTGFVVVNHVEMENYLRGVVPVEMGRRTRQEAAALEAQAIASRSYAYVRVTAEGGVGGQRAFDVRASTADQVYGGVDAEYDLADAAVADTRGLVLRHDRRIADAPYSSTCGGTTAERDEVWRGSGAPYLRRVSDRIGDTDRHYCDAAPRFRWTRTLSRSQLDSALGQYLRQYTSVPEGGPGAARRIAVESRTPSGRVGILAIHTDRGNFALQGNHIRYVMRDAGGEILPSTYFSVEPEIAGDGRVARVTFRGRGNGHGIGMCQWGAIGRARAGQSFRTILGTYYPGTSVGPVQ